MRKGIVAAVLALTAALPASAQAPSDIVQDALTRSTLAQDRAYAFSAAWSLAYSVGDESKRCSATSSFRPAPLPESAREDEVIVAARRASRENDWQVATAGDKDCARLLRSFLADVRTSRDRGDGILFVDSGESRVSAFTVIEDSAERFVVEGAIEPTARTSREARNAMRGLIRRYEIARAGPRVEKIRQRSMRPRRVLAGLASVKSVETVSSVGRFAGLCCVETESSSAIAAGILGADIVLDMTYRLTSLEPQ